MRTISLTDGTSVPALGLGTWFYGEQKRRRPAEVALLRQAFEIGWRLLDTAEMYGEGGSEEVIGQALAEAFQAGTLSRDEIFVVSKVYPHNASRAGVAAACDRSRRRLGLDRIDLYLLHWPGSHPLAETVSGFEDLRSRGAIGHWGVSNFDVSDMADLVAVPGGERCAANQVYYSLSERGPEIELLPGQRARGIPAMAYCPIDQGALLGSKDLQALAAARGVTAAQLALAWLIDRGDVLAIPRTHRVERLKENFDAASVALTEADRAALDTMFSPPTRKRALAMR